LLAGVGGASHECAGADRSVRAAGKGEGAGHHGEER